MSDHINLSGASPLFGHNEDRFGPRFPDCSHMYDTRGAREQPVVLAGVRGAYAAHLPSARRFLLNQSAHGLVALGLLYLALAARHMGIACEALAVATHASDAASGERALWIPPSPSVSSDALNEMLSACIARWGTT